MVKAAIAVAVDVQVKIRVSINKICRVNLQIFYNNNNYPITIFFTSMLPTTVFTYGLPSLIPINP